jgi:hypothetical protein
MCAPVAAVAGLEIAAQLAQSAAASKQAAAQRRVLAVQRRAQAEEIRAAALNRGTQRARQGRAERARIQVAAGEAGIGGVSAADLLQSSLFNQSEDVALIAKDAFFQDRASDARYQSGLAQAQGPSPLELGLGIATSAYAGVSKARAAREGRQFVDPYNPGLVVAPPA